MSIFNKKTVLKGFNTVENFDICEDDQIRNKAIFMLTSKYMEQGKYEKTQEMLDLKQTYGSCKSIGTQIAVDGNHCSYTRIDSKKGRMLCILPAADLSISLND